MRLEFLPFVDDGIQMGCLIGVLCVKLTNKRQWKLEQKTKSISTKFEIKLEMYVDASHLNKMRNANEKTSIAFLYILINMFRCVDQKLIGPKETSDDLRNTRAAPVERRMCIECHGEAQVKGISDYINNSGSRAEAIHQM